MAGTKGLRDLGAIHRPVLLQQCVDLATPALTGRDAVVVDCTLGLAGHATAFLKAAPGCRLIGIDRDPEALELADERIRQEGLEARFTSVHATFDALNDVLDEQGIDAVDAVFMDLGLSSLQIDEVDRGFSYAMNTRLDMRMDPSQGPSAADILASRSAQELAHIFEAYGEERFSRPIAKAIVRRRATEPITTSEQLDRLVDEVVPRSHRPAGNPAKRVFQALRIEVNGELDQLERTLPQAATRLRVGGRLVVESYQSLEDRCVKRFMAQGINVDVPPDMPIVPKDAQPFFDDLTHGAVKADDRQIETNPRSASVRLRAVALSRALPERWRTRFENAAHQTSGRHTGLEHHHRHEGRG